MGKNPILQRAVHAALAAAAASAAVPAAYAQTAPAAAAAGTPEIQEVIVTGSRIQSANLISASPITTVTNVDIQQSGLNRVEDILNNLPQVFAGQGSNMSNGADGTATVDLHDLGPQRTLVLVNSKRLAPGAPDGRNFADINQIPAELIEKSRSADRRRFLDVRRGCRIGRRELHHEHPLRRRENRRPVRHVQP